MREAGVRWADIRSLVRMTFGVQNGARLVKARRVGNLPTARNTNAKTVGRLPTLRMVTRC